MLLAVSGVLLASEQLPPVPAEFSSLLPVVLAVPLQSEQAAERLLPPPAWLAVLLPPHEHVGPIDVLPPLFVFAQLSLLLPSPSSEPTPPSLQSQSSFPLPPSSSILFEASVPLLSPSAGA